MSAANEPRHHPARHDQREDEVHLRDYLKVLVRRAPILVVTFLVIFVGTALLTFSSPHIYQSQTLLRIRASNTRNAGFLGSMPVFSQIDPVETEIEVLKTKALAREVVRDLGLDVAVAPEKAGFFTRVLRRVGLVSTMEDPTPDSVTLEVPKDLLGVPLRLEFAPDGMDYSLALDEQRVLKGKAGVEAADFGVKVLVRREKPLTGGGTCVVTKFSPEAIAAGLAGRLGVSPVGRNTEIIRLTVQDTNPGKAARVLDAYNRLYVQKDIDDKSKEASATLDFIREQSRLYRERIDKAQTALNDYKAKTGVVALSQEAQLLVQRVSDLEVELSRISVTRFGIQQVTRAIQEGGVLNPAGLGALGVSSPELASLMNGYQTLGQKRADLLKDYTPENPLVKGIDAQMALAAEQVRTTAGAILGATIQREKSLEEVLTVYRGQLARLPQIEQDLARLEKDVLTQEKIYGFLLDSEQQTQILRASTVSGIRVVDPPVPGAFPVAPKTRQNLVLGFLLGIFMGVGLAFFVDYLDDSIKDLEDLGRRFRVSCYGAIPFIREAHERRKEKMPHLVIEEKRSPVSEAFRSLRTNVMLASVDNPPRLITVTSPGMGEGKTFTAVNLGAVSALAGRKTLYIDCDLRKPQGHIVFGLDNEVGLANYLAGQVDLHQLVKGTSVEGLSAITSGPIPPNPSEMLGSARMAALLERLKGDYELILLDTPPITMVADPLILAKISDLTLVVVRSGVTPTSALRGALEQLQALQVTASGAVLNAVGKSRLGKYGYRYYQKGYGYGYGYGYEQSYGSNQKGE